MNTRLVQHHDRILFEFFSIFLLPYITACLSVNSQMELSTRSFSSSSMEPVAIFLHAHLVPPFPAASPLYLIGTPHMQYTSLPWSQYNIPCLPTFWSPPCSISDI